MPNTIPTDDFAAEPFFEVRPAKFDGSCDPAFDSDLGDLERQFAEFRFALTDEFY
jgi:hypothetical protein